MCRPGNGIHCYYPYCRDHALPEQVDYQGETFTVFSQSMLVVDPDRDPTKFWASWIRIRHYLYGS
jgi:hypothetical protein